MTFIKPLSEMYEMFAKGEMSKNDFEGRIFHYLLNNQDRYKLFSSNRDRWSDFVSWFYSRLSRAIDLYKDIGSSFDSYFTVIVNRSAKEYRSREADQNLTEYVCWQARAEEMTLFENEPEYSESFDMKSLPKGINPRQLLFLLLKSYFHANDEMVKLVARSNRLEYEAVRKMIDDIRKMRLHREIEMQDLKDRLYLQYYRCLAYHKRLNNILPDSFYYEKMKSRFERARKRLNTMKKRLATMRMTASNRMIAMVVGVPPGTVDSGLAAIKNRLAVYLDEGDSA